MSKLTEALAASLDACIIENFADLYVMEAALKRIEKKHDLDDPAVIAGLATCADITAVQERLTPRPAQALAKGLKSALDRGSLRPTAALLARALLAGAELEAGASGTSTPAKKLPAFARPARLPPPVTAAGKRASAAEVEALVNAIAAASPGEPPATSFTAASLAALGRALALGWLSHGSEPKHAWGAFAASLYPDDTTARDLGMMARELGPRVGQFKKAQILVDVLAAMNTPASLEALNELATKVRTASVRDRARAAFDGAAKRMALSTHGLADRLIREPGKDFAKRLEQRMITGSAMSALELVENILQRKTVRSAARGVVFATPRGEKLVAFTIGDKDDAELIDVDGKPFTLPGEASVVVVHPLDLPGTQLTKWRERITRGPAWQLQRKTRTFASLAAMKKELGKKLRDAGELSERPLHGLLALGWSRGAATGGGVYTTLARVLDGLEVTLELDPGVYAGRGMARPQHITKLTTRGEGSPRALSEIARELEPLLR